LTVHADNAMQIKRDLENLINHYSATYSDPPRYAPALALYQQSLLTHDQELSSPGTLKVLGQLGLGYGVELLSLWFAKRILTPNSRLQLKLFHATPVSCAELASCWQALGLLAPTHPLSSLAEALLKAHPAAIYGCQRLSFDDGRFILDLHFGDITAELKGLPPPHGQLIQSWMVHPSHPIATITEKLAWQLARLSTDEADIRVADDVGFEALGTVCRRVGLVLTSLATPETRQDMDDILLAERRALNHAQAQAYGFCPLPQGRHDPNATDPSYFDAPVAIIGGGLASAHLALSLAERGQACRVFCKDKQLGLGASGNKQGALYPLLTPENSPLSRFFQQAFLFSRRRVQQLLSQGHHIGHDFCGVLQTGHDDRSCDRLNKIMSGQDWPADIARTVDAKDANELAGISIDKPGFFYPLGGWICPFEYARAAMESAVSLGKADVSFECEIDALIERHGAWYLRQGDIEHGPFLRVVVASGEQLTRFSQTSALQASGFRGQVSHVPTRGDLSRLGTVLCAHGYLTPAHGGLHCVGASYVKDARHQDYCPAEQEENLQKMRHSYPGQDWLEDIDISGASARVGVRMVTRDHFPMVGCAPDLAEILRRYQTQQLTRESRSYWQQTQAPVLRGLYVLGALGSRGLSSGPLAAECLASLMCDELPPVDHETLSLLSPNRMWLRKLVKGKAL
jgi:tRNA 5-methylaminomethyl-2-thiouridine biosynthesis bifunctional protein